MSEALSVVVALSGVSTCVRRTGSADVPCTYCLSDTRVAVPGVALTEKTIPFAEAFTKRFGGAPSYAGYMAYDATHYAAEAIKRAGSTEADKLVEALEKTDYTGTVGRITFYGKDEPFTHSIQYGQGLMTSVLGQWQSGKQVAIWPAATANGTMILPPAVKPAVQ